jgi:hypothetical protein
VKRIRLATTDSGGWPLRAETEKFDRWRETNFKFMNYAKRSLLGDERVLHAIMQPEIRTHEFTILGREFYRLVSPTHVSILTDREMIIIIEGETRSAGERYGGTWHYIPLSRIADLSLTRRDGGNPVMSVLPMGAAPVLSLFHSAAEPELRLLIDRFRELTASR